MHFCKPVWCHPEVSAEAVGNLAHCVCWAAEGGCHVAPPATWHPGTPPLPPTRGWCEKTMGGNLGMVCNVGAGLGMVQQGGPATQVACSMAMAGVYGVALTTQGSPLTWVATTKGTSSASMWPGQLASQASLPRVACGAQGCARSLGLVVAGWGGPTGQCARGGLMALQLALTLGHASLHPGTTLASQALPLYFRALIRAKILGQGKRLNIFWFLAASAQPQGLCQV